MEVTQGGVTGLGVASPVVEEPSNALVHAPIPRLQTEERTAVDWDELKNHGDVTHLDAQVQLF